jgi:outer membrane immunogenic protein
MMGADPQAAFSLNVGTLRELGMKLLSGILGLTLTSVLALASANAADMYVAPAAAGGYKEGPAYVAVDWAGFYAGVNGGYGWSQDDNQLANAKAQFGGLSPSGGFGGGQIGYNWQGIWHPHLVLGIEADIQGAGIDDKVTFNNIGVTWGSNLDYFGTVRGRVGYAMDSTLVYFTGGFAYGGIKNQVTAPGGVDFNIDRTATGYVLGGGIEYKFWRSWSVKAEYQYINLGKNDPTFDGVAFTSIGGVDRDDAFHTVRLGLNYHFLPSYEPLK